MQPSGVEMREPSTIHRRLGVSLAAAAAANAKFLLDVSSPGLSLQPSNDSMLVNNPSIARLTLDAQPTILPCHLPFQHMLSEHRLTKIACRLILSTYICSSSDNSKDLIAMPMN